MQYRCHCAIHTTHTVYCFLGLPMPLHLHDRLPLQFLSFLLDNTITTNGLLFQRCSSPESNPPTKLVAKGWQAHGVQSDARCNPRACHMLATALLLLSEDFMVILCVFYQCGCLLTSGNRSQIKLNMNDASVVALSPSAAAQLPTGSSWASRHAARSSFATATVQFPTIALHTHSTTCHVLLQGRACRLPKTGPVQLATSAGC